MRPLNAWNVTSLAPFAFPGFVVFNGPAGAARPIASRWDDVGILRRVFVAFRAVCFLGVVIFSPPQPGTPVTNNQTITFKVAK
jgi:hypothetical protein